MSVVLEEINNGVLCEAKSVMNPEAVGRRSLGGVVVQFLPHPLEHVREAVDDIGARIRNSLELVHIQGVAGGLGHEPCFEAW